MNIHLSDHFTYKKLLRFTLPSIIMMIFTSVYGVVDGLFVSNYVGKMAFASVNLIMPFLQILGGMGAMLGVGGSALVSLTLGEGSKTRAGKYFSMMIYVMAAVGIICTAIGIVFIRPVAYLLGASEAMIGDCVLYGRVVLIFNTMLLAQYTFQSYIVVAEKPAFGLIITVAAGVTNMVLDALFVAVLQWGIAGAALATGMSQCVGAIIPFVWFLSKKNQSALHFIKTKIEWRPIMKACGNGMSEMLTSISGSITGILYNRQLMRYAGEDGVAAYGVVMYAAFIFIAILIGYSSGSSPIVGYHYGAQNHKEIRNLLKKSLTLLIATGVVLTALAVMTAQPIAAVFVGYDEALMKMTIRAFRICAIPFLIMGVSIYASSFFTALNDGVVSAEISFFRSLLFPVAAIIVLPIFFELDGVWFSLVGSELLSFVTAVIFLKVKQKKYKY